MAARKNIDGFAAGMMFLLCMTWGLQQVAIKAAGHDIAPIMQVGLRCGISAILVGIVMLVRRERFLLRDGTLLPGIVAGILFAVEFLFVAKGLEHTSASHMAIFLYSAPVFTALGLHLTIPAERLTPRQWAGIGIAFCGIATAFAAGFPGTRISSETLLGDTLGILGGAAWGATTVVIRCSSLSEAAPGKTLVYQLAAGFVVILGAAAALGQIGAVTMTRLAWASLLFQSVIVSFASYLAWLWLLRRYLASRLAAFSFMTPLFGVSFGVMLLHEPLDGCFALGAALVLTGITLVSLRLPSRSTATVAALAESD